MKVKKFLRFIIKEEMMNRYLKYRLLDMLDDLRSTQKMINLHQENFDDNEIITTFTLNQYKDIRIRLIKEFNNIKNDK
jgi:hypothetical protein